MTTIKGWKIDPFDGITVLQVLDRLTDRHIYNEYDEIDCCDVDMEVVIKTGDPFGFVWVYSHDHDCAWMRGHAILNKSTVHLPWVHAWKETP